MASMTFTDPLLEKYNLASSEETRVTAIIAAVDGAIDRACRRNIAYGTYSKTFYEAKESIHLPAYPVASINRICDGTNAVLSITGTATYNRARTTVASLILERVVNGVSTPTVLTFVSYPTLGLLAAAISATPTFQAQLPSDYSSHPSSDLVAGQFASGSISLNIWQDFNGSYDSANLQIGWLNLCGSHLKVDWSGGIDPYPADLKLVVAELVGYVLDGKTGVVNSVSYGGEYSYTVGAVSLDRLPITFRKILDTYKTPPLA